MLWLQTMRSKYGVEPDAVTYGEVMRIYAETYVSINYFYFVVVGIDILSLTIFFGMLSPICCARILLVNFLWSNATTSLTYSSVLTHTRLASDCVVSALHHYTSPTLILLCT